MINMDIKRTINSVYGLVLAGGLSMRMGHDKGKIFWHGVEQRYFLADLLGHITIKTFISIRPEQKDEIDPKFDTIVDTFDNLGQYGAILGALDNYPDRAFLVIACDLPFIDRKSLEYLLENRDKTKLATAFISSYDGLPEPLAAIWEPGSKKRLHKLLEEGITCPRKALIKSSGNVHLIKPLFSEFTMNTNTHDEAIKAKRIIKERGFNIFNG